MDNSGIFLIYICLVFVINIASINEKEEIIIPPAAIVLEEEEEAKEEEIEPELINLGEYKITYYCACMKCCGKTNGITASGEKVQAGITIAAPKEFSFGTQLMINNHIYTVQDRGGAIKNKRLDIYCETHEEAIKNGVDYFTVYEINTMSP